MSGLLNSFMGGGNGILSSLFGGAQGMQSGFVDPKPMSGTDRLLQFIQSPEALGLAAGLLEQSAPSFDKVPSFGAGLGKGLENVIKIKAENAKHGGLQGKFGKALTDYNAILTAYGPDHEYTKLAKQNLENLSAGSQGLSFEFDPVTGAYTLGLGGTAKSGGGKGAPTIAGEGADKKIRTPPTPAITTDVQTQKIARERAKILNPYLQHPYTGSGSNSQLAADVYNYRKNPTPELREKLVKAATANKLASYGATLNLISEGGGTGESATKRQENAVKQGWAEGVTLGLKNVPQDVIEEGNERAAAIKDRISEASEEQFATGFPIDLPRDRSKKETPKAKVVPNVGKFKDDRAGEAYLNSIGVSADKIREIANKHKITIQQLAEKVAAEQSK